jgi:hypothetical protein
MTTARFDALIHPPTRLAIVSLLAASQPAPVSGTNRSPACRAISRRSESNQPNRGGHVQLPRLACGGVQFL